MPHEIAAIRREHCEAVVQDQLDRHSASTANTRYRSLQRFFGWAEDQGKIDISPICCWRSAPRRRKRASCAPRRGARGLHRR